MADKSTQLTLEALSRAALDPAGTPLHGSRTNPGLFPNSAPARQAAQRCKDDGLLEVVGTTSRGKQTQEICTITERGRTWLLENADAGQILGDCVRILEARQEQLAELAENVQRLQQNFAAMRHLLDRLFSQASTTTPATTAPAPDAWPWHETLLQKLAQWRRTDTDCPLPELFRQVVQSAPALTIGRFHDGLRVLHEHNKIYLHPWTGPLYDLPEPPYALLIGHEVAYYASLR